MTQEKRKGLHKNFHVSRLDTYISAVAAIVFAVLDLLNYSVWQISDLYEWVIHFSLQCYSESLEWWHGYIINCLKSNTTKRIRILHLL